MWDCEIISKPEYISNLLAKIFLIFHAMLDHPFDDLRNSVIINIIKSIFNSRSLFYLPTEGKKKHYLHTFNNVTVSIHTNQKLFNCNFPLSVLCVAFVVHNFIFLIDFKLDSTIYVLQKKNSSTSINSILIIFRNDFQYFIVFKLNVLFLFLFFVD